MSSNFGSPMSLSSHFDFDDDCTKFEDTELSAYGNDGAHQLGLTSSSLAFLNICQTRTEPKMKIKTLSPGEMSVPLGNMKSIHDVKEYLCAGTPLQAKDVLFICEGKEMKDSLQLMDLDMKLKYFALVRTSAKSSIPLLCKEGGVSSRFPATASTRIFHLKRELASRKITKLRTGSQRLTVGGRQLHDNMLLGDYLLQSAASKKKMVTANGEIVLHIFRTMNVDHEIEVVSHLNNFAEMRFSMEISIPITFMREILMRQFCIPKDFPLSISLKIHNRIVELHPDYTLIDYGVTSEMKSIEVMIAKLAEDDVLHPLPTQYRIPTPAEAFSQDDRIDLVHLAATISSNVSTPVKTLQTIDTKLSPPSTKSPTTSKKRAISEKSSTKSSTTMFKGMKKGFFDSKAKTPKCSPSREDASSKPDFRETNFVHDSVNPTNMVVHDVGSADNLSPKGSHTVKS